MRNILITGHSSGIGKQIAKIALNDQNKIFGISRNKSDINGITEEFRADLSDINGIMKATNWLKNKKIDILIHSAGSNEIKSIDECKIIDYQNSYNLHFLSASQLIKPILKSMKDNNRGRLIFISSIWSEIACHSRGAYCASKSALNSLARQIAVEYSDTKITSQCVVLGFVDTPLSKKTENDSRLKFAKERISCEGNIPNPLEIADEIYRLATSENSYLNGSKFYLDGGILSR
tara:strand:+ start:219 stop:920 length:702 start_codon:yes stop_codon:yes gene_type:complete